MTDSKVVPVSSRVAACLTTTSSQAKRAFSREQSVAGGDPVLRVVLRAWPAPGTTLSVTQATVTPQTVELD
jgi:hypothetical protein